MQTNSKLASPDSGVVYGCAGLTMTQAGMFMSIPVLMLGYIFCKEYGFYAAISNIVFGNFIMLLLSLPMVIRAAISKQTSSAQVQAVLGSVGNKVSMLGLIILLLGWFSVELNITSQAVLETIHNAAGASGSMVLENKLFNCAIAAFISFTVIAGIRGVQRVVKVSLILFLITIGATVLYFGYKVGFVIPDTSELNVRLLVPRAFLLVMGTCFGTMMELPTFYRFARSKSCSIASVILVFGLGFPLIESIGALLYQCVGKNTIVQTLLSSDLNVGLQFWNVCFVVLSMCALNNVNLYVASVNSNTLLGGLGFKYRVCVLGAIGALLACINLSGNFLVLLDKMLIVVASIFPLLILNIILFPKLKMRLGNAAMAAGIVAGMLSALFPQAATLSFVPSLAYINAAFVTVAVYVGGHLVTAALGKLSLH